MQLFVQSEVVVDNQVQGKQTDFSHVSAPFPAREGLPGDLVDQGRVELT